jgi:hypothetical protein
MAQRTPVPDVLSPELPVPVEPDVPMPDAVPDEPEVAVPAGIAPAPLPCCAPSLTLPLDVVPDAEPPRISSPALTPALLPVELHAARARAARPPIRLPRYVFMAHSRD